MFEKCSVKQLTNFLSDFKKHHTIKNYSKMKKSTLVKEIECLYNNLFSHKIPLMQGGTAKNAGFVRRLQAENKIIFDKIHNPSKYMIDRYGHQVEPMDQDEPQYEDEHLIAPPLPQTNGSPIFQPNEVIEFNVAKEKPKKTKPNRTVPTEAEEDKREEARQKEIESLELIRKQMVECKFKLDADENRYRNALKELKSKKGMRLNQKEEFEQKIIEKHLANMKKIRGSYPKVFQYLKEKKLNKNDLNAAQKFIRIQISKL